MTKARINFFTTWLVAIALVWTAVIAVGVTGAVAEGPTLYRYTKHKATQQSVVVWFQADTKNKKKIKLFLPLELRQRQSIVDGIFSGKTGLLATMTGTRPSVFEFTMSADLKRVRQIEERNPTDQDKNFFTGLLAGNGAKEDSLLTFMSNRPECRATIYTAGNCGPCKTLKAQIANNPKQYGCNQITWIDCGPDYRYPSQECRNAGITSFPTIQGKVCSDCNSTPPDPEPPLNPHPPTDPNPGGRCTGQAKIECPTPNGYSCCLYGCDSTQPSGCRQCQSFRPCQPNSCPSGRTCENPRDPNNCPQDFVCKSPTPVYPQPPSPNPPTCPPGQTRKWVEGSCDGDICTPGYWICEPVVLPPPPPPQPPHPPQPPQPPPPTTPCTVTYSCRYPDGSRGSGTVTCSPNASVVTGHFGTLNCLTCAYTPSSNCSGAATGLQSGSGLIPETNAPLPGATSPAVGRPTTRRS